MARLSISALFECIAPLAESSTTDIYSKERIAEDAQANRVSAFLTRQGMAVKRAILTDVY